MTTREVVQMLEALERVVAQRAEQIMQSVGNRAAVDAYLVDIHTAVVTLRQDAERRLEVIDGEKM